MRSFIGAVKAMSKCIPKYASLLSPLEDSIKGLEGKQSVTWTSDLHQAFLSIQDALRSTKTLTIPKPSDKLIMTVDASPSNNGLGATLFVVRDDKKMVAEFFSFKMKTHQTNWIPCEHEALAIATGVNHFSPYLRESEHPLLVYTDSKPCVQAYYKLTKGHFSASARISTFLSTLSSYRVKLSHIKGEDNIISDFSSRNPSECSTDGCQICKFVYETSTSVVNAISVSDVLSGTISMPYTNTSAWKSAQHECLALRRLFAHLSEGTRPAKKAKNLKDLRRYLLVASINPRGLLVVNKPDQYLQNRELIIVPKSILPGLLTALHLQLSHPSIHQMKKVFSRYFYGLGFENDIQHVVDACDHCASLKTVSPELFSQGTTTVPDCPGKLFTADVIHRSRQRLFVVRDVFSSYTSGTIITDVTASSLRKALLTHTALFRLNPCDVHTDNASGFQALLNDSELESAGVRLQFGHVKNKNKNCVVDRAIQELERELLKELPQKEQLSSNDLQHILDILNARVRNRNLSAKEILFQRDMITGNQLSFTDKELSEQQDKLRTENHLTSAKSKSKGGSIATACPVKVGDLVYIKQEGSKFASRDRYMVMQVYEDKAILQKLTSNSFGTKKYEVPLTGIYHSPASSMYHNWDKHEDNSDNSDSDFDASANETVPIQDEVDEDIQNEHEVSSDDDGQAINQRPPRTRVQPAWLRSGEYDLK